MRFVSAYSRSTDRQTKTKTKKKAPFDITLLCSSMCVASLALKNMSHSEEKKLSKKFRKFLLFNTLRAFHGPIRILIPRIRSNTLGRSKVIHERACKKNKEISWFFDRPIKNTLQSRKQEDCLPLSATTRMSVTRFFYAPVATMFARIRKLQAKL